MIAADGFDFGKPYEPKVDAKVSAGDTPAGPVDEPPPRRPLRPVAALLGGMGKK